MSSAGPTSWYGVTGQSIATGRLCAVRLLFAGAFQTRASQSLAPPEAGEKTSNAKALPCSTSLLRAALAWLTPGYWLTRCWAAFAETALPAELATLLCALNAGQ